MFALNVDQQHLDMYTYKVEDDDLQLLISPFTTAEELSSHVSVTFSFFFLFKK